MNRIYKSIIIIIYFFSFSAQGQEQGNYYIRNYTADEYGSHNQNWAVVQDNRGVMYFGNTENIVEYDGTNWRYIYVSNKSAVRSFAVNSEGTVFVGGNGDFGYLKPDSIGKLEYISLISLINEEIEFTNIWEIFVNENYVYFRTPSALFRYDTEKQKIKLWEAEFKRGMFIPELENPVLLVGSEGQLLQLKNDSLHVLSEKENILKYITSAISFNKEKFILATRDKLYFYNFLQKNTALRVQQFKTDADEHFLDSRIYKMSIINQNQFAVSTLYGGCFILDFKGKLIKKIDKSCDLQNEIVYYTYTKKDQPLWLAVNKGVSKVEIKSPFTIWDDNTNFRSSVNRIIRHNNYIYIASMDGLFYLNREKMTGVKVIHNNSKETWGFAKFYDAEKNKTRLYLAGENLYEVVDTTLKAIMKFESFLYKLYVPESVPNRMYVSTKSEVKSLVYSGEKWMEDGSIKINALVRYMTEDEEGNLWVGTNFKGIYKLSFKNNIIENYNKFEGVDDISFIRVFSDEDKILLPTRNGIFKYNKNSNTFERDTIYLNNISGQYKGIELVQFGLDNNYWIHTNSGIIRYKQLADNSFSIDSVIFQRINDFSIYYSYPDTDFVWFGGPCGIIKYDKENTEFNPASKYNTLIRKVYLENDSILFFGTNYDTIEKIITLEQSESNIPIIDYKNNSINIEFAAPYFIQEEKTLYSYKLENFDKKWSKWDSETKNKYTNLPEGEYTFKVKAINIFKNESSIAKYRFVISSPWYRSWWAYSLYFVFIIFLILAILKLYTRTLRLKNSKLRRVVRESTAEILEKNEELFQQKEELITTLAKLQERQSQLIQSEKMASIGIITAGIAHEINNPLNFIQGGASLIKEFTEENYPEHINELMPLVRMIGEGVDRASRIANSLNRLNREDSDLNQECDIALIFDNCFAVLHTRLGQKIKVIKQYEPNHFIIKGDENELLRAFLNTLRNAVQAIEGKGIISVEMEFEASELIIKISDNGCGISEKNINKVSVPFYTTRDPGDGIGLGMSITYAIIEKHRGTIKYESELGQGTTVIIVLPAENKIE